MSSKPTSNTRPIKPSASIRSRKKIQNRSKHGCGNCRLRRVKCDEKRPGCEQCQRNHISCTYATKSIDLQSSHEEAITCLPLATTHFSSNEAALGSINHSLYDYHARNPKTGHSQLRLEDLSILLRFKSETVHCIGAQWEDNSKVLDTEFIRLASLNPYLLHVSMTCTAMHDRYLHGQSHLKRTEFECYHWAMSARLFNHEISRASHTYDRDAIWMAATLINWIVLYAVETKNPKDVWPLSSELSDIPWLPIQRCMRDIWQLAGPDRADSIFSSAHRDNERCLGLPPPKSGIEGIPTALVELCGLDESSTSENSPYHTAVRALCTKNNPSPRPDALTFMGFIVTMNEGFEILLKKKDPRSLLLTSIWYGLVPKSAWWIAPRAELERKAICIYLDRYHADDVLVNRVLASSLTSS